MFTYRERFFIAQRGSNMYAPLSIGSPEYTTNVDYSVFKKSKKEKAECAAIKAQHRRDLIRVYGEGTKRLNVSLADV